MSKEKKDLIHNILAHSYLSYFVFSMVGLFIDTFTNFEVKMRFAQPIALVCFITGTVLIFWAQNTSRNALKNKTGVYFYSGPYRFLRNPTHLGMVILVTGYTLVSGSIFFLIITTVGYMFSNIFFKKYEKILTDTYGDEYDQYKNKVPKIF